MMVPANMSVSVFAASLFASVFTVLTLVFMARVLSLLWRVFVLVVRYHAQPAHVYTCGRVGLVRRATLGGEYRFARVR